MIRKYKDKHGLPKSHKTFLSLSTEQLQEKRKCLQKKYEKLPTFSVCSNIVTQTLQELQILKEIYVLLIKNLSYKQK